MRRTALLAALVLATAANANPRPFDVRDLVALERVSDPRVSPDGESVAFALRQTDLEANKGVNSIWLRALDGDAPPKRLTPAGLSASSPRWGADGRHVYFIAAKEGLAQVHRVAVAGGAPEAITALPLDVGSFALSPKGDALAVSMEVFPDCDTLTCTKERLDAQAKGVPSGTVHEKIFIRHWDTWKNGTRSQLFVLPLAQGRAGEPVHVSKGIDGDVPSKPFGDDAEYAFAPDGRSIVFGARIAGKTEPWSTNFDLWQAPVDGSAAPENLTAQNLATDTGPVFAPDGRTLYYRAMKRAGFEADRLAITALDLRSGQRRELAPDFDRSADALAISRDGRTLYLTVQDVGQVALYALDVRRGVAPRKLVGEGTVAGLSVGDDEVVYALDDLRSPAQLYRLPTRGRASTRRLTDVNRERLAQLAMGDFEQFSFAGWNGEKVHGYLVKPANFEPGRKYPVAFLIHGGPQGSFGNHWHYRWNPQTYAGQGFAAVMIDFHGSTGYGQAFTDSISGDWGGKPLEDLKQGLAFALRKYPFLDGDKVCALGGSYGGYMVNWIAGQWPEPFRCLVSHSGVFDNRMMGYSTEELWFDEWEFGGTPYEHAAKYERHNPVNHVAQWRVPMLVIHGQLDYRIPVEQGIAAFTALQRRGIESKFLYFPDENHWILKPANSVLWHDTVHGWLREHFGR